MEISQISGAVKGASTLYESLSKSYKRIRVRRVEKFFECVDLRMEHATQEDVNELIQTINSPEGEEVLASFADSITTTSCERVLMALAMLYCKDLDFAFNESELYTFISAMEGMDNDLLDFFLLVSDIPSTSANYAYPRSAISKQDYIGYFGARWDEEAVFVYINDLQRLRLILPDPCTTYTIPGNSDSWTLWFGITARTLKMARLIKKAEYYLNI
ncbi:hypothetical protein H4F05_06605 [Vibrio cholerae]